MWAYLQNFNDLLKLSWEPRRLGTHNPPLQRWGLEPQPVDAAFTCNAIDMLGSKRSFVAYLSLFAMQPRLQLQLDSPLQDFRIPDGFTHMLLDVKQGTGLSIVIRYDFLR